jgi:hypothetical protein
MELIDLYASEVGRHLPEKMRADIEKETHSMIEDTLEDESRAQGKPVDEAMLVAVLKRLGAPEKMAASYLPPRYLIGPELFPAFIQTLRVVLPIILALLVLGLGLRLGFSVKVPADIATAFGLALSGLFNAVFYAVGIIVLVFAVLQWTSPQTKMGASQTSKEWDPLKLKAQPDPEVIKPASLIVDVVFTLVALVVFNVFPQWIGIYNNINGEWSFTPVLAQAFFQYLPWISVLWALSASLKIVVVSQGRWQAATRWAAIGLGLFTIGLVERMLTGPDLIAIDYSALSRMGWLTGDPSLAAMLNNLTNAALRLGFGITIVVQVVEVAKSLYKLLIKGRISHVAGV